MDDAAGVGSAERLGDPGGERDGFADRERLALQTASEILALEPLHDQEGRAGRGDAVRDVADDALVR